MDKLVHSSFNCRRRRLGFTLIELLVVISIISILAGIGYVNFQSAQNASRDARRKQDLKTISTALVSYYQDNDAYPPSTEIGIPKEYASDGSDPWIPGLSSSYINKLPKDPKQAGILSGLANLIGTKSKQLPQVASSHASALVGWWKFDECSGPTANDSSGRGNHGFLVNSPTWTANGKSGCALDFNGTNSYVSAPDSPSLSVTGNTISLAAWIKPSRTGANEQVLGKWGAGQDSYQFRINSNNGCNSTTNRITFRVEAPTNCVLSNATLTAGQWWFVVGTYDGSNLRIYINGTLDNTASVSTALTDKTSSFSVGRNDDGGYFQGVVDDVRIYNRALTLAEIQQDMNPNLVVDSVITNKTSYTPAEPGTVTVTVRNASSMNVISSFQVSTWFSSGPAAQPACNAAAHASSLVLQLAAGATWTTTYNFSAPSTSGTYRASSYVDSSCVIAESQEGTQGVTINGDNYRPSANYTVTAPPTPTPTPSPSPSPGPSVCAGKKNVYCYQVIANRSSFVLWAQLDRSNDPEALGGASAICSATPPDANYNYCLESPK